MVLGQIRPSHHNSARIRKVDKEFAKKFNFKIHVDLLLIGEECKKHYVLIQDFNTSMYDHTLHSEMVQ